MRAAIIGAWSRSSWRRIAPVLVGPVPVVPRALRTGSAQQRQARPCRIASYRPVRRRKKFWKSSGRRPNRCVL